MGAAVRIFEIQRFALRSQLEGRAVLLARAVDQQLLAGRKLTVRQGVGFARLIAQRHAGQGCGR